MLYIAIILCIVLSGFFSMSEISFVSADRLKVELDKNSGNIISKIATHFYNNGSHFITTALVGNNIVNVVYGLLFAQLLEAPLTQLLHNDMAVVLIQTLVSTALIIVFSEYIPKAIGQSKPNLMVRIITLPFFAIYIVLFPITLLIGWISKLFFKMFGISNEDDTVQPLSKVDLDYFIESNVTQQDNADEARILQNALEFSEIKVRDCLVPRNEIVAVSYDLEREELISIFDKTGFSKLPVYKEDIDDIIGYIHSIEMFRMVESSDWHTRILTTIFIPESLAAEKALKQLMQKKRSLAIIVDELGGTAGMVTLEDIVEEIFGDIEDEHDTQRIAMRKVGENEYIISGRAEVDTLNEVFDLEIPENEDYQTLAGFILHHSQEIPEAGDELSIPPQFQIQIMRATGNKITLVRLRKIEP
ncbi:MAG: hemolysin family protein [Porphyromonas sp.]|nr:hemolysin family protein [Porphyromonas sp.]